MGDHFNNDKCTAILSGFCCSLHDGDGDDEVLGLKKSLIMTTHRRIGSVSLNKNSLQIKRKRRKMAVGVSINLSVSLITFTSGKVMMMMMMMMMSQHNNKH